MLEPNRWDHVVLGSLATLLAGLLGLLYISVRSSNLAWGVMTMDVALLGFVWLILSKGVFYSRSRRYSRYDDEIGFRRGMRGVFALVLFSQLLAFVAGRIEVVKQRQLVGTPPTPYAVPPQEHPSRPLKSLFTLRRVEGDRDDYRKLLRALRHDAETLDHCLESDPSWEAFSANVRVANGRVDEASVVGTSARCVPEVLRGLKISEVVSGTFAFEAKRKRRRPQAIPR
jgi:hypothetical protein